MATRETGPVGSGPLGQQHLGAEPYGRETTGADAGIDAGRTGRAPRLPRRGARHRRSGSARVWRPSPPPTFLLSLFNAKIVKNESLEAVVLPLALFYGGLAQLLAGMWEFKKANTFGATAFASFGAFWLAFAAYVKFVVPGLPTADAHTATGLFLLVFAIFTTYMFVASLRVSGAVALVFITSGRDLLVAGDRQPERHDRTSSRSAATSASITAVAAWYASFATVTNDTWKRTLLPTLPARQR